MISASLSHSFIHLSSPSPHLSSPHPLLLPPFLISLVHISPTHISHFLFCKNFKGSLKIPIIINGNMATESPSPQSSAHSQTSQTDDISLSIVTFIHSSILNILFFLISIKPFKQHITVAVLASEYVIKYCREYDTSDVISQMCLNSIVDLSGSVSSAG